MKLARIILFLNLFAQTTLGLIMLLLPSLMSQLIFVPVPYVFIQTIGSVALSIALLCLLAIQKTRRNTNSEIAFVALATLAMFNLGLATFLGIGAFRHLISWLGIIVHLPLAALCVYALLIINKGENR